MIALDVKKHTDSIIDAHRKSDTFIQLSQYNKKDASACRQNCKLWSVRKLSDDPDIDA
jgi:hypothetical protein